MTVIRYISAVMAFLVGLSINVFASDTTGVLSVEQNIAIENADYYRQLSDEYEKQGDTNPTNRGR